MDEIIAVTGPRGRLGSELVRRGCIPIEADVTDFAELNRAILAIKPDVIIHCAAKTNVDACETQVRDAMKVNAGGTYGLAQVFPGKIVYISTDFIFDGEDGPYDEKAKPNPISIYGWSKLGGEIALRNRNNPDDLIVRTTVLFDKYSKNFVTVVIKKLLNGEAVKLPDDLIGNPTYIPHLTEGILATIERGIVGVLNIAGLGLMSRRQLGFLFARVLNLPSNRIQSGPVTGRAPRPHKAGLDIWEAACLDIPLSFAPDGIREIIEYLYPSIPLSYLTPTEELFNALETMDAG